MSAHAEASLMLASGSDMTKVSKRPGRSSLAIVSDTYAHLLSGAGRQAAAVAEALVPRQPREQFDLRGRIRYPGGLFRCRSERY
jgi:hypothetical protein